MQVRVCPRLCNLLSDDGCWHKRFTTFKIFSINTGRFVDLGIMRLLSDSISHQPPQWNMWFLWQSISFHVSHQNSILLSKKQITNLLTSTHIRRNPAQLLIWARFAERGHHLDCSHRLRIANTSSRCRPAPEDRRFEIRDGSSSCRCEYIPCCNSPVLPRSLLRWEPG